MSHLKLEELKLDVAELNKLSNLAERQKIKDIFTIEIRKLETEITGISERLNEQKTLGQEVPKKIVSSQNRCFHVTLTNYAWDQSDNFVKLFVTVQNVHTAPEGSIHCDFNSSSVEMTIKALENRNYSFTLKNLLESIDVATSKWKVKKDMVVILLSKSNKTKWSHLTSVEKKAKEPKAKLPDVDANGDPTNHLMEMMKQMYEDGDDDMKRTIAQSWTESSNKSNGGW